MINIDLNGIWKMKSTEEEIWINGNVPGSVFNDLLRSGKIDDPFYRDNEDKAMDIALRDYEYTRDFTADSDLLNSECILLHCDGIDTIASIKINDILVGETNNMHSQYEFDIKDLLHYGKNNIHILLKSPVKYIEQRQREYPLWGSQDTIQGYPYIRKAHCMFGWDWGPKIPDSGIWRSISIRGYNTARIEDVYITQFREKNTVSLDIRTNYKKYSSEKIDISVKITSPDNDVFVKKIAGQKAEEHINIKIDNPKLWWPNGYGQQPLYRIDVSLQKDGLPLDEKTLFTGLRTMKLVREKDSFGESFKFEVNGVSIFAMGADYIPEDSLLPRCSYERTEKLIQNCISANFNFLRVWGGGIYPEDYFYDLCDRYGIIVWQDFMFACSVYRLDEEFKSNIIKEAKDNIKRIRHHACLGLWCGNNEIEEEWPSWNFPKTARLRADYIKMFEIILPDIVQEMDPNTAYWPSSPSSGGGFEDPNSENSGDVHYWDVWHGLKPFTDYRNYYFRFVSEFGFQSFPCLKTVGSFTLPEDRNAFSYVMEKHQKNGSANGKILFYLSQNFRYPKDFDSLLYVSQILQAEAIKYGVEHWRRNRGRCMGTIYWQLNDCWPVASWSSIDYFGRWKALHYFAKKFYSPVLLSACENDTGAKLYITNETMQKAKGKLVWQLKGNESEIYREGELDVEIEPLTSSMLLELDFSDILGDISTRRKTHLYYAFVQGSSIISSGTTIFVKAKHFEFKNPQIKFDVQEKADCFNIKIESSAYARYVELSLENTDCIFSDNYFDISAGEEKIVSVSKDNLPAQVSLEELKQALKIRSLYDIA